MGPGEARLLRSKLYRSNWASSGFRALSVERRNGPVVCRLHPAYFSTWFLAGGVVLRPPTPPCLRQESRLCPESGSASLSGSRGGQTVRVGPRTILMPKKSTGQNCFFQRER